MQRTENMLRWTFFSPLKSPSSSTSEAFTNRSTKYDLSKKMMMSTHLRLFRQRIHVRLCSWCPSV